jgi:L-asparaginase type II
VVHLFGAGGTILSQGDSKLDYISYGSTGKSLTAEEMVARLPEVSRFARVTAEQITSGSGTAGPALWLRVAKRINEVLNGRPEVAGVVMTHGSAILEETAYFLHLTVKSEKPVVVTGSLRPLSALGTDAEANLLAAVRVAAAAEAQSKGTLVVLNDEIHSARDVTKTDSHRVQSFKSPELGLLGYADSDLRVVFYRVPVRRHTSRSEFEVDKLDRLPRVEIVHSYGGAEDAALKGVLTAKPDGIVLAGTGSGNAMRVIEEGLYAAAKSGIPVVLTTQVGSGRVVRSVRSEQLGFIPGDNLTPRKARILLMLALTVTKDPKRISRMFETY